MSLGFVAEVFTALVWEDFCPGEDGECLSSLLHLLGSSGLTPAWDWQPKLLWTSEPPSNQIFQVVGE